MKLAPRKPRLWISLLLYPLAMFSLLIVFAGGYMWIRSHYIAERWGWATLSHDRKDTRLVDIELWSSRGGVGMYRNDYLNLPRTSAGWPFYHDTNNVMTDYPYIAISAKGIPETRWKLGDFAYCRSELDREKLKMEMNGQTFYNGDENVATSVVVPWWSFCAIGAVLPLVATRRVIRNRRWRRQKRDGVCTNCGYDLRATPGCCPECGQLAPEVRP